jgi:hypothetical protein
MGPALGREQKSSKKRELWKSALHHQLSGTYRQKIGSVVYGVSVFNPPH